MKNFISLLILTLVNASPASAIQPAFDFKLFRNYLVSNSNNYKIPKDKKVSIYQVKSEKIFGYQPIAEQQKLFQIIGPTLRIGKNYPDNLFISQNAFGLPPSSLLGTSPSPFALRVSINLADRKGRLGFSFKGTGGKI